jgi:ABC-type uncharacterized transport system permease subunit
MKVENFMNFSMVVGFFVGIFFAFLNFDSIIEIVFSAIVINFIIYAVVSFSASMFMKYFSFKQKQFAKRSYDEILDYYVGEIEKKDNRMESIIEQIDELNQSFAHIVEVETEADDKAKVK